MKLKRLGNGDYYLTKSNKFIKSGCPSNIFLVKFGNNTCGKLDNNITTPTELIGRRIRLKVEFVDDKSVFEEENKIETESSKEVNEMIKRYI